MTPEKLGRLDYLNEKWRTRTDAEGEELDALRRELAASPELPDNPCTPFVDESSRPNLDGSNYNDTLRAMCRDEVEGLVLKYGAELLRVVVPLVLKG